MLGSSSNIAGTRYRTPSFLPEDEEQQRLLRERYQYGEEVGPEVVSPSMSEYERPSVPYQAPAIAPELTDGLEEEDMSSPITDDMELGGMIDDGSSGPQETAAYKRYQDLAAQPVEDLEPSKKRRFLAAALAGVGGYVNAGGRVRVDTDQLVDGVLGTAARKRKMQERQAALDAAYKGASLESTANQQDINNKRVGAYDKGAQAQIKRAEADIERAKAATKKLDINPADQKLQAKLQAIKEIDARVERYMRDKTDPLGMSPEAAARARVNIYTDKVTESVQDRTTISGNDAAILKGIKGAEAQQTANLDLTKAKTNAQNSVATKNNRPPVPKVGRGGSGSEKVSPVTKLEVEMTKKELGVLMASEKQLIQKSAAADQTMKSIAASANMTVEQLASQINNVNLPVSLRNKFNAARVERDTIHGGRGGADGIGELTKIRAAIADTKRRAVGILGGGVTSRPTVPARSAPATVAPGVPVPPNLPGIRLMPRPILPGK